MTSQTEEKTETININTAEITGNKEEKEIRLPYQVKQIIKRLQANGYEAYAVGGCVRDSLLGRKPGDWDITTSAQPTDVKRVFRHTVDTGIAHGTVTVLVKKHAPKQEEEKPQEGLITERPFGRGKKKKQEEPREPQYHTYEVTTYRIDGTYLDGRHPEKVTFTPSLEEDLKRRDFTINAMAYSEDAGLKDCFGGMEDLKAHVIRCVGDPEERFSEDALRILRAVRFAAQLDFSIDPKTEAAITRHAENLQNVSRERIQTEISKLLCSVHPEKTEELFRLGMAPFLSECFPLANSGIFAELPMASKALPAGKKYLRYALLLCGMQEKDARALLRGLKLDNDTQKNALLLSQGMLSYIKTEPYALKKVMQTMPPMLFEELLHLKKKISGTALYRDRCYGEDTHALLRLFAEIRRKEEPVYMEDLAVRGSDLIAAGVKPGPYVGEILSAMLDDVLHEPLHNSILYLLSQYLYRLKA